MALVADGASACIVLDDLTQFLGFDVAYTQCP
jgi:hypothetical protein